MLVTLPRVLVTLLTLIAAAAAAIVLGFAGAHQFLAPEIPSASELREVRSQLPLQVLSRDGKLIAQFGEQRRIPVTYDEIPKVVITRFLRPKTTASSSTPGWTGRVSFAP
jgi:penicillin-binding protein 1A